MTWPAGACRACRAPGSLRPGVSPALFPGPRGPTGARTRRWGTATTISCAAGSRAAPAPSAPAPAPTPWPAPPDRRRSRTHLLCGRGGAADDDDVAAGGIEHPLRGGGDILARQPGDPLGVAAGPAVILTAQQGVEP